MSWTEIKDRWPALIDDIRQRWPETATDTLQEIAGDRSRFTDHLAQSHDLTWAEAADAIEIWLMQRAALLAA